MTIRIPLGAETMRSVRAKRAPPNGHSCASETPSIPSPLFRPRPSRGHLELWFRYLLRSRTVFLGGPRPLCPKMALSTYEEASEAHLPSLPPVPSRVVLRVGSCSAGIAGERTNCNCCRLRQIVQASGFLCNVAPLSHYSPQGDPLRHCSSPSFEMLCSDREIGK